MLMGKRVYCWLSKAPKIEPKLKTEKTINEVSRQFGVKVLRDCSLDLIGRVNNNVT